MKKHKTLIIVFGIIIFLAIFGLAYWLIIGSKPSTPSSIGSFSPTSTSVVSQTSTATSTTADNSTCIRRVKALCAGTDDPASCEAAAIPKLCP